MSFLDYMVLFLVAPGVLLVWFGGFYAGRVFERHWPKKRVSKTDALEALDNMDDFARMANVDPSGPRSVLRSFIEGK